MARTAAQAAVRAAFKKCVECFNKQPYSGGAAPGNYGPYNRSYWYENAEGTGLWYYNNFIAQSWPSFYAGDTPPYCRTDEIDIVSQLYVDSYYPDVTNHNTIFSFLGTHTPNYLSPYYQRWSYMSIDISGYDNDTVQGTTSIHLILTFYNNDAYWHSLGLTESPIIFYFVPYNEALPAASWYTKASPGSVLTSVNMTFAGLGIPQVKKIDITSQYKQAKQAGYTAFNICMKPSGIGTGSDLASVYYWRTNKVAPYPGKPLIYFSY